MFTEYTSEACSHNYHLSLFTYSVNIHACTWLYLYMYRAAFVGGICSPLPPLAILTYSANTPPHTHLVGHVPTHMDGGFTSNILVLLLCFYNYLGVYKLNILSLYIMLHVCCSTIIVNL